VTITLISGAAEPDTFHPKNKLSESMSMQIWVGGSWNGAPDAISKREGGISLHCSI
jgi:hypothetical protein